MWRQDEEERAKAGHERRMGKSTMPLIVKKIGAFTIRVIDAENGSTTDWDTSAWRVRRIGEYDPS